MRPLAELVLDGVEATIPYRQGLAAALRCQTLLPARAEGLGGGAAQDLKSLAKPVFIAKRFNQKSVMPPRLFSVNEKLILKISCELSDATAIDFFVKILYNSNHYFMTDAIFFALVNGSAKNFRLFI